MARRDFENRIMAEVAKCPGASAEFGRRRRHPVVYLTVEGRTRYVVYPGSPSDNGHALRNNICEVRRVLAHLRNGD